MLDEIRGIHLDGKPITGREPIGAAVSVGIKSSNGQPIDKDRFFIVSPVAHNEEYQGRNGSYKAPKRDLLPGFESFNTAPAEKRRAIPIRLAHRTVPECFTYYLAAQTLQKKGHPKKAPMCRGDGRRAMRWMGDAYKEIECPGLGRCPFTAPPEKGKPECGAKMVFLARFDWPRIDGKGFQNLPFKYVSGGRHMVHGFLGFFEQFERVARELGVDPASVPLFGFPALLQLAEKTNPQDGTRFPVVSLVLRAEEGDWLSWILAQASRRDEIKRLYSAPVLALTDREYDTSGDNDLISGPQGIPT